MTDYDTSMEESDEFPEIYAILYTPSFDYFSGGLGGRVYEKLTGKRVSKLRHWMDLKSALIAFGAGNSEQIKKIDRDGLNKVAFFSSSETLIAVVLLMMSDRGREAQEIATKIDWWSSYGRTADETTRIVIGKLMTL